MLVFDPALVTNDMVEEVLKYKRLDGVDAALNTIAGACFAGGRQSLELEPRLIEIAAPVQVIWGREDRILPVAHSDGLPAKISVIVLDAAGHLVHMEKSAEVNAAITRLVT
jgi:pyruvate dehydrogenase E2 component (dihydrolipoamide acetyltransferase)